MSIAAKLLLRQEDLVFDAAPEHTTSLPCLVSGVPELYKNIQKVSARETCVSAAREFFCSCSPLEVVQVLFELAALCSETMETLEEEILILFLF